MQAADAAYVEPDSRTNEGRGEIKQSSCFHWPVLLYGPYFKDAPICPRHPEAPWWEVIKRLAAHQLHGESHPSRGSHATAPIACDGSRPKRWPLQRSDVRLDGSIIVPAAGHGRTGSHPVLTACCFSLLAGKNKPKTCIFFFGGVSLFSSGRSPRSSRLGFGFRQSSGNVPDEWACNFQGSGRGHRKTSHPFCRWVRGLHNTTLKFF